MYNERNEKPDSEEEEDEDIISSSIGEYGKWQLCLTFLLSLVNIPCTWHIYAPTFLGEDRQVWCARPKRFSYVDPILWYNSTQPAGICQIFNLTHLNSSTIDALENIQTYPGIHLVDCTKWEFDGEGETTISEFNLVCERSQLNNMAEMMFLAGVAVGGLVSGVISDKYGRKRTLMVSIFLQSLIGTVIAFAPYFEMYFVLRAALGFISVSVVFSGFVLSIELVGGVWRTVAGISYLFPVSISYMCIAGIAYFLRNWRHLQLAISVPGFLFLGLWWILPESPRWYLAMGKTKEVIVILQKAAKINGRVLPANLDKQLQPTSCDEQPSAGVLDLFRAKQIRKNTLLLFVIWFSVYLAYYGLVLNMGKIGGNLYINSVIQGAVEIPGIAVSILILLKMGRRWPLALTMILGGIACLFTIPIPFLLDGSNWLAISLTMLAKFSFSSSNAVMPVFTAELYPTTIRNIGVGASNVSAGVALMLVPYLWELKHLHVTVPMSVIAFWGVLGGACVLFLPETGNAPLKDTIDDGKCKSRSK